MPRQYEQLARLPVVDATNENLVDLGLAGWLFAGVSEGFLFLRREYDQSIGWRDHFAGKIRGVEVQIAEGEEAPMPGLRSAATEGSKEAEEEAPPPRGPIVRGHLRLVEPGETAPLREAPVSV